MTKQDIAKRIDKLNWSNIQCDYPADGTYYEILREELMKLEKEEIMNVLFAVIEAQNLPDDFMGENRTMHEFKYLD